MTTELAIANAGAVALAADSAVTVGQQKIYNSALKVFTLSKYAPVGVMVYGSAQFMGVPWESLIKLYRTYLGQQRYRAITDYAKDFFRFLEGVQDIFPAEVQESWIKGNATAIATAVKDDVVARVRQTITNTGAISEETTHACVARSINDLHDRLKQRQRLKTMTADVEKALRTRYRASFRDAMQEVLQGLMPKGRTLTKLYDLAVFAHTRDMFSSGHSGIVVAGFGEQEIFPIIDTYQVEGMVMGHLKMKRVEEKCHTIDGGTGVTIIPFAQDDMVRTFMQGMNPVVQTFLEKYLTQLFLRLPDIVDDSDWVDAKKSKAILQKDSQELLERFFQQLNLHTQSEHVKPILEMVAALPKDELALMAETLVSLTAFKRRLTSTLETVGGPVDVAVISKGDGLVWVKRKHYFPKDLNYHFFQNYLREPNYEEDSEY